MSERPKIYVKPNGSIRVTGAADFVDAEGNVIETKENVSFCRCGHSKEKHTVMARIVNLSFKVS